MKIEVGQIVIGGRWITVPRGYIQAEYEYTEEESRFFEALFPGPAKEIARTRVLEKRLEFYELYVAGKASIKKLEPVRQKTWRDYIQWLIGDKWPK